MNLDTHIYISTITFSHFWSSEEFRLPAGLAIHGRHYPALIPQLEPLLDHGNFNHQNSKKTRHGGYRPSAGVEETGQEVEGEAVEEVESQ